MNIVLDSTSSVTIRVARPSGGDLALLSDTLIVRWDAENRRLSVVRGGGGEPDAEVYASDLSALSLRDDELFDYRQRFDSHLRPSVLERVEQEGDCLLEDYYGESGLVALANNLNGEFAELMASPIKGWSLPEDVTANDLFDVVLKRVAAKTGQTWELDLTTARLARIVEDHFELEEKSVRPSTTWSEVGADSLDLVELTMAAEAEFDVEIDDADAQAVVTVGGMASLIATLLKTRPLRPKVSDQTET